MDIHAAIEEFLGTKQNSITHSTYVWYARFLGYFDEWTRDHHITDLSQVTPIHVQQFVSACPTTNTNTRHARAQIVKGFLSWCSKDEEMGVKERTVKRIEMPKLVQSEVTLFTDGEIMRLFKACDKMKNPHRNKAIVHMLLDTGIRAAELCYDAERVDEETGLKMECLVLGRDGESFIWVMGKGQKARTVGLGNETTMALRKYLNRERGRSDSPYVFLARGDEPLSVRMLQQFLDRLGELADVENTHPHRFRHTFAVNQLMQGTSDLVLMRLLGHTTLDSTKIYTKAMTQLQARKAAPSIVDKIKSGKGYIR